MSDEPKKKGGLFKWLLIATVILLLLGGAAGGGYWYFVVNASAANGAAKPEAEGEESADDEGDAEDEASEDAGEDGDADEKPSKPPKGAAVVALEPFIVNLADGGSRYLRTTVKLVTRTEEAAAKLTESEVTATRVRSAVLELLAEQESAVLVTAAGKSDLKKRIQERVGDTAGVRIVDVLFADFVVQF